MIIAPVQDSTTTSLKSQTAESRGKNRISGFLSSTVYKHLVLLVFTALLLFSTLAISANRLAVQAANAGNACAWYRVHWGDTLSGIAWRYHNTAWTLGRVNNIRNINLIFVGQALCIPYNSGNNSWRGAGSGGTGGLLSNGVVPWYDYRALDWSSRSEVSSLLRQAAYRYGLPANLLLAIAWQESGWNQHVIARDGGIGVMQLMPYTAMSINVGTGIRRNPYKLWDNINLGATYLNWLWHNFHGNLVDVISAYNEGGWAVIHRGIFNWRYVNSVLYLMRRF
jgi:Transglycosylase SLT domain/LysM domain